MTDQSTHRYSVAGRPESRARNSGTFLFAGIAKIMAAAAQALASMRIMFAPEFFVPTGNDILRFDVAGLGWLHVLLCLLVGLAGYAVTSGRTWPKARG